MPGNTYDLFQGGFSLTVGQIPYRKIVTKVFTIPQGVLCASFTGIQIMAIATCEADMSVYQYGVVKDPVTNKVAVSYDPEKRIYASSSVNTIPDFTFPPLTSNTARRGLNVDDAEATGSNINSPSIAKDSDLVNHVFKAAVIVMLGMLLYQGSRTNNNKPLELTAMPHVVSNAPAAHHVVSDPGPIEKDQQWCRWVSGEKA
jgi:hypothetical protein